ncbi:MAG: hypothetical protein K1X79_02380 [Oligoflexia bacterium]|nr:hypothetical protein [Oligoflexia bacterium]
MQPISNLSRVIVLFVFSILPSCVTVNGEEYGWSDMKKMFSSADSQNREQYLQQHAGEPLAELARNDPQMLVGDAHGLYFKESLPLLKERDALVEKSQKQQIGSPEWLETQAQLSAKSDRIVATERTGWTRKGTEVTAAKTNAEAQMKAMTNPEPAKRAISMLDGQRDFINARLDVLSRFPAGNTDANFVIPMEIPKPEAPKGEEPKAPTTK